MSTYCNGNLIGCTYGHGIHEEMNLRGVYTIFLTRDELFECIENQLKNVKQNNQEEDTDYEPEI